MTDAGLAELDPDTGQMMCINCRARYNSSAAARDCCLACAPAPDDELLVGGDGNSLAIGLEGQPETRIQTTDAMEVSR